MPPLLKPCECTLLVLYSAGPVTPQERDGEVLANRKRILQAATVCEVPTILAVPDHKRFGPDSEPPQERVYSPPMPGNPWGETPLGLALARASRSSILICGYWLDECITFTSLNALGEGYDIYLITDASPPLDVAERNMAILRLVQASVVPTTTRQVVREWATEISDVTQRDQLLGLI
jgi:Isochorismatase family